MITLNAPGIWQWDVGHTVSVDSADAIHFAMPGDETALVVEPTGSGTSYTASVPNILLQRSGTLACWKVVDGKSEQMTRIEVKPKPKPADYVYEETTVDDYQQIKEWFTDSVEELEADYTAAIAEVETATDSATDAAASANAAASAAQSAIDAMTGNVLRGTVGPSKVVGVDDAYPQVPLGLKVKGVTRQNLWANINFTNYGITCTDNENGSMTLEGTLDSSNRVVSKTIYSLKPGTTYTFSVSTSLPAGFSFFVREYSEQGGGIIKQTSPTVSGATFTVNASTKFATVGLRMVEAGSTVSGTYRVMLNEGSEAEPWCPPGLNSIEGLTIRQTGKNLFPALNGLGGLELADDGGLIIGVGATWAYKNYSVSLRQGDRLTLSNSNPIPKANAGVGIGLYFNDGSSHEEYLYGSMPETNFTVQKDVKQIRFFFNAPPGAITESMTIYPQLEFGDEATAFEKPNHNDTTVNLNSNALRSLPDGTCDVLTIGEDGTAGIERAVGSGKIPTNAGSVSWQEEYKRIYFSLSPRAQDTTSNASQRVMCDKVPARAAGQVAGEGTHVSTTRDPSRAYVRIDGSTSAEDVVSRVGGGEIVYLLSNPDRVEIGNAVTLPALSGPTANVWAVATDGHGNTFTLQPEVELEYARDVTLVIGSLEAKVAALELLHETE